MVPGGRAERAIEIARAGRLAGGPDHARRRRRAAAGTEAALFQEPEVGRPQGRRKAGEIDLQRRRDPEGRAGVGGIDAGRAKSVGQRLGLPGVATAQIGNHGRCGRGQHRRVEPIEQHREAFAPDGIAPMPVGGDRRNARLDRLGAWRFRRGRKASASAAAAAACARDASAMKTKPAFRRMAVARAARAARPCGRSAGRDREG